MDKKDTITYEYRDGSGNRYLLTEDTLDYQPVKARQSSSGLYSGGEPQQIKLSEADREQLIALLKKAADDPAAQLDRREMGTGQIFIRKNEGAGSFIIKRNSPHREAIESFLKKLLTSKE